MWESRGKESINPVFFCPPCGDLVPQTAVAHEVFEVVTSSAMLTSFYPYPSF